MTSAINLSEILPILSLTQAVSGLLFAVVLVFLTALIVKSVRRLFSHARIEPKNDVEEAPNLSGAPTTVALQILHRRQ